MSFKHSKSNSALIGIRFSLTTIVACGVIYTSAITLVGGQLFPSQSTGSLIIRDGNPIGSELIAQDFVDKKYFYARPSAAGFDPTSTGGSNLAPSNSELRSQAKAHSARIAQIEGVAVYEIPVELLAASGAGLDPHISPAAAEFQAPRIAKERAVPLEEVMSLISQNIEEKQLGLFGQRRVNVLKLNLALDNAANKEEK